MRQAMPVRLAGADIRLDLNRRRGGPSRYDQSSECHSVAFWCSDILGDLFRGRRPRAVGHDLVGRDLIRSLRAY
jgi:hypothetical protein